uniref:Uncharacterized protein n=1 Tax=Oryza punctata TaxID=4537 RepID=A0A0E0MGJ4_ORYPU
MAAVPADLSSPASQLEMRGGDLGLGVEGMRGGPATVGLTTVTLFGTIPLLGGVVMALTPLSQHQPRATLAIGGLLQWLRRSIGLGE